MVPEIFSYGVAEVVGGVATVLVFCFAIVALSLRNTTPEQRPAILHALADLFRSLLRKQ
jgi:hypothetical protein